MVARLSSFTRELTQVIRPLGWIVLALAVVVAALAWWWHWRELMVVAACALVLVLAALPFLLGRTKVDVQLLLEPDRVTAGDSTAAAVMVRNLASGRLLPTTLEVPVGQALHRYGLSSLPSGAVHEEAFTIRTERRGVIPVGPALTRRGDPLGLFSRDVVWTGVREVLVRPKLLSLEALGTGLLRDLEGVSTDAVSHSDLAFHALREYVPGDDLRHVHWRSSAKAMAATGNTSLLVRQYVDTRRSHATLVVEDRASIWAGLDHEAASDDGFEIAMQVAASVAVRAILDEFDVSFVCGAHGSTGTDPHLALDAMCRAQRGDTGIVASGRRAVTMAPDTSLAFFITAGGADFADLQQASAAFAPEVRRFALLVEPGARSRVTEIKGMPVLHLGSPTDLAGLLRWSVR